MQIPACNCGSQTPGLHGPGCVRQSSLFGDLSTFPSGLLLQQLQALRSNRQGEPDRTVQLSLQLMIDDVVAEMDRRNQHVIGERAARRSAS